MRLLCLYYVCNENRVLYRYNLNTEEHTVIFEPNNIDEGVHWFATYKDMLFVGMSGILYKTNQDGSEKTIFAEMQDNVYNGFGFAAISNDQVYYFRDNAVYRQAINQGDEIKVCDAKSGKSNFGYAKVNYGINDSGLYFTN